MIQIHDDQLETIALQRLGEEWIQAIMEGALERLEKFCMPAVSSQLLTPRRFVTLDTAADLVERFRLWFGQCTDFQLEASRIGKVGERLGIFYRFQLREGGARYNIEQQLFCTLEQGQITRIHLLCSGFQLVGENNSQTPHPDQLLEFYTGSSTTDSVCAVLTPSIRAKLREMQTGQILEVRVDDPTARGDIEAWSRLSGNELLTVIEDDTPIRHFFLKKK